MGGEIDQKVETLFSEGPDGEKDQLAIPFRFTKHLDLVQSAARVIKTFEKVKTLFSSRVAGLVVEVVHLEQMTAAGANTC